MQRGTGLSTAGSSCQGVADVGTSRGWRPASPNPQGSTNRNRRLPSGFSSEAPRGRAAVIQALSPPPGLLPSAWPCRHSPGDPCLRGCGSTPSRAPWNRARGTGYSAASTTNL